MFQDKLTDYQLFCMISKERKYVVLFLFLHSLFDMSYTIITEFGQEDNTQVSTYHNFQCPWIKKEKKTKKTEWYIMNTSNYDIKITSLCYLWIRKNNFLYNNRIHYLKLMNYVMAVNYFPSSEFDLDWLYFI